MRLKKKDGTEYVLTDKVQIEAFVNAGWEIVQDKSTVPPRPEHLNLKTSRERKVPE